MSDMDIDRHLRAKIADLTEECKTLRTQLDAAVAAERDCRTCAHYLPHHRAGVMHCTAPLRCVAGSSYCKAGRVQQWEAAPVDAGF